MWLRIVLDSTTFAPVTIALTTHANAKSDPNPTLNPNRTPRKTQNLFLIQSLTLYCWRQ